MKKGSGFPFIFLSFVLFVSACNIPTQDNHQPPPTEVPSSNTGTTPVPVGAVEHRIGVRAVNGVSEFYDRITGEKFVPRGNNYVQLEPQKRDDGSTQNYHAVFDPGTYDSSRIASAFQQMHVQGYNVVRVFLSQNTIGAPSGGLDPTYMANVVDFLRLAKASELYAIPTLDWMPGGKYGALLDQDCCEEFTMMNVNFLTPGGLEANQAFFQDFARYLLDHGAPMDALFAYELRNELYFDMNFPPLSLTSGTLPTLNGRIYNMADLASKKQMMDENLVYWIDQMREAILEVDPTALVSLGFFSPQDPNPNRIGDTRYVTTRPAIWESKADFIDLHPYPAAELTLQQYVENFGMEGMQDKPIIMGEFGVSKASISTEQTAARTLMHWQVDSCKYGFDGWLLWEWNVNEGTSEFYNPMSEKGYVNQVLAPINRPDPCMPGQFDFIENNVALGSDVTASRFLENEPPSNAVDGTGAQWGAGVSPQQWVQIDLGKPYSVNNTLTVAQYPDGSTTHQVWVRGPNEQLRLVHTFSESTKDNQVLSFIPDQPLTGIQIVRIMTTSSPSWVAWKEIEVIAP